MPWACMVGCQGTRAEGQPPREGSGRLSGRVGAGSCALDRSPFQLAWQMVLQELLVAGAQGLRIGGRVRLGVQVVGLK